MGKNGKLELKITSYGDKYQQVKLVIITKEVAKLFSIFKKVPKGERAFRLHSLQKQIPLFTLTKASRWKAQKQISISVSNFEFHPAGSKLDVAN